MLLMDSLEMTMFFSVFGRELSALFSVRVSKMRALNIVRKNFFENCSVEAEVDSETIIAVKNATDEISGTGTSTGNKKIKMKVFFGENLLIRTYALFSKSIPSRNQLFYGWH